MFDHVNYKEVVENVGVRSFCRMKKRCKNQIKIPLNFARKTLLVFFVIVKKLFYLQNSLKECPFPEGQPQLLFPYDIKKKETTQLFSIILKVFVSRELYFIIYFHRFKICFNLFENNRRWWLFSKKMILHSSL